MNTYTVYDTTGRKTKSVGNYVAQATPPDQWVWREVSGVFGWRLSLTNDTLVSHGANNDENIITSNKYDLAGRVKEVRDTLGRVTQYTYDAVGRLTKTIANFVDGVFSSSATDEDITSQTAYNKAGQVINTTDPHGTITEFAYDVAGRRVSIKHAKNTALESVNYTCFNKAGWVLRMISNTIATSTSPDAKTGTAWDFNPTAHGTYNDENLITEYEFDTLGRQTKVINPLGEFTTTTYAKDGSVMSVTDPEGTVTAYRYDKLRRRRMIVQGYVANGQDPANWVWDATDARWEQSAGTAIAHGTDNDQNIIVQLTHNIAGRVLTMRNPRGHVTSYAYDNLNRRVQLQNPLGNTWLTSYEELGDGGRRTVTTYPEHTDPLPFKTTHEFDRMGRLMSIGYGDYAVTNTPNIAFGYDVLGNRTSMSELGVADALIRQTQFEYDNARRMKTVGYDSDGNGTINETVSYEYDERGLRTKLTFDGKNITYVYDAKGRLISMTDWDARTTTYDYDDVNRHRLTSRQNGVTSAYTHNTAGGLTDIHHKNSSNATLARFTYTLDGRGHRTQANETLNGSPKTVTYAYDQLARVKNAKYYTGTVPTGTPANEYVYGFDVAGNRLSESHAVNGGTPTVTNYTYNSANRLTNAGYTYDANGNLTNNGVSAYTWDRANRLTSVGDSTNGFTDYAYDGLGNRLSKTIGASITEYLVDMQPSLAVILREKIGSDNTHYVHGLRGIASQQVGSVWSDAASDGLGSVRGWLNGSQNFVSDVDYNPYGVPSGAVDDFGFTGEMTDANGLVYLRARYYDPNVGVFASLDPFEGVNNRPMSVNGYSWVEGNVANWSDASGMCVNTEVSQMIGQSTNINTCTFLGYDTEACSLLTARNSTVTIAAFGLFDSPDTRTDNSIKGIGAIVQRNGKEYLLTHDHFDRTSGNQCSSFSYLESKHPFLYIEGALGGWVFYVPDLEQTCIPHSGYMFLSFKDASLSFSSFRIVRSVASINATGNLNNVSVAYSSIPYLNRDSFRVLSPTFTVRHSITLRNVSFEYQPYSALRFYTGSLHGTGTTWLIYDGEGGQGDSGNVAFNGQDAVAVFSDQEARFSGVSYLADPLENIVNLIAGIQINSGIEMDYPTRDSTYRSIQQYP